MFKESEHKNAVTPPPMQGALRKLVVFLMLLVAIAFSFAVTPPPRMVQPIRGSGTLVSSLTETQAPST